MVIVGIILITAFAACAPTSEQKKYTPFYIYEGIKDDNNIDNRIISWKDNTKHKHKLNEILMGPSNDFQREEAQEEKTLELFEKKYVLKYDSSSYSMDVIHEPKKMFDYYSNDECSASFDSITGELMYFSHGNKAFLPFPTTPPTEKKEYELYCINLAKETLGKIYNLDNHEVFILNDDTVVFCKTLNGYKTYSIITATFRRESTVKGFEREGGLQSIKYFDYSEEYKAFENIIIDEKKLQSEIDEAKAEIITNSEKYDSIQTETDKFLVIIDGELYVRVTFSPEGVLRESGEQRKQAPLEIVIRVS